MRNIILLTFSAVVFCSFGQEKMVVVKQSDVQPVNKTRTKKNDREVEYKSAIKVDPLRMMIGEINFSWERKIKERLTFETEFGPTLSNIKFLRNSGNHYLSGTTGDEFISAFGLMVSGGFRYYPLPRARAFEGLYLSPRVKYRRYNETIHSSLDGLADKNGFTNEVMVQFTVGLQHWISTSLAFDYYVGIGLGSYNKTSYVSITDYDPNVNETVNTWVTDANKMALFSALIGLKVSVGH